MRKFTLYFIVFLFLAISCEKDHGYQNQGTLTGYDFRRCMCCGGYIVEIEDSTYRFYNMPDGFTFNLEVDTFPLQVLLNWQSDSILCLGDEIIVSKMTRKED